MYICRKFEFMKFNITRQQVFPSLVTVFITSLIGAFVLARGSHGAVQLLSSESILGNYITEFQASHSGWSALIAALLIFLTATNLGRVISTQNLYSSATSIQIPMLGALIWCMVISRNSLLASIVISLSAQGLGGLLYAARNNNHLGYLFNASLAFSILPLFYTSAITLWIAIPIIMLFVGFTLREWIISISGLLLPLFSISYIYWLCGYDFIYASETMIIMLTEKSNIFDLRILMPFRTTALAISLLLAIGSTIWIGESVPKSRIRLQITFIAAISSLLSLFSPSATLLTFALATPALAILASLTMVHLPAIAANIIYSLLFLLLLLAAFNPLYLPL